MSLININSTPTKRWLVILGLCFLVSPSSQSQDTLAPDDPSVLSFFFRFYQGITEEIEKRNASPKANGDEFFRGALDSLNLRETDFVSIGVISRQVHAQLSKLQEEKRTYFEQVRARNERPNTARRAQFAARRRKVLTDARAALKAAVSNAGWIALERHMERTSKTIHVRRGDDGEDVK